MPDNLPKDLIDHGVWWPRMKAEGFALLGIPYKLGAEPPIDIFPPRALDCSELIEILFKRQGFMDCPDGSWVQHGASKSVKGLKISARPGDWGFFQKKSKIKKGNPRGIYHVGMLFDDRNVLEARAMDSRGRYGMVILRPRKNWERFSGFRRAGGWKRWEGFL